MPHPLRHYERPCNSKRRTYLREECHRRVAEGARHLAYDWRATDKQRTDPELRVEENDNHVFRRNKQEE